MAKALSARLEKPCIYIKQDSYYKDHPDMSFEERERINYDEPAAFEHDALRDDLIRLRNGQSITAKEYDYTHHRRCDPGFTIEPADVVLVEGIHIFYDPEVRALMDFKIYIQVDPDVCLLRRVKRDIRDRGRTIERSPTPQFKSINSLALSFLHNPTLTSIHDHRKNHSLD